MHNVAIVDLGLFGNVIEVVNMGLANAHIIAKYIWESNCEKCPLREKAEDPAHGDVVRCGHPEHINYINVDNCVYRRCPLIKKRGDHDV